MSGKGQLYSIFHKEAVYKWMFASLQGFRTESPIVPKVSGYSKTNE